MQIKKLTSITKAVQPFDTYATIQGISEMPYAPDSIKITPMSWHKYISFRNGKKDHNAIDLLTEIVYWYRSHVVRDELTGDIKGYHKKFSADKFQCSHEEFARRLSLTIDEVVAGLSRLEKSGFITREFRTTNNVQFLAPVVHAVRAITQ